MRAVLLYTLCFGGLAWEFEQANQSFNGIKRNLEAECSTISSCSECSNTDGCAFLNGACTTDPELTMIFRDYDQETQVEYCQNAIAADSIYLNDSSPRVFEMTHFPNASMAPDTACEWKILLDSYENVTLEITRSSLNYENINLYYYQETGGLYMKTNDLSSCSQEAYSIELKNTKYFRIRVDQLNRASNYTIRLVHDVIDTSMGTGMIVYLSIAVYCLYWSMSLLIFLCSLLISQVVQEHLKKKRAIAYYYKCLARKDIRIQNTLKYMIHGKMSELNAKYQEDACVVCLENFNADDDVHITNECCHVFHSECLKEWFNNVDVRIPLKCPHCSTKTAENSKPNGEGTPNKDEDEAELHLDSIDDESGPHMPSPTRVISTVAPLPN